MIPQLNQVCDVYTQEFSAGGDSEITKKYSNVRCRASFGESYLPQQKVGEYIKVDGFLFVPETPELERDMIVKVNSDFYTIYSVQKTRDLSGKPLFQYVTLRINKNVTI